MSSVSALPSLLRMSGLKSAQALLLSVVPCLSSQGPPHLLEQTNETSRLPWGVPSLVGIVLALQLDVFGQLGKCTLALSQHDISKELVDVINN